MWTAKSTVGGSQAKNSSQTTPTHIKVKEGHMTNLKSCSNIRHNKRDTVHGVSYSIGDEEGWTPVIGMEEEICPPASPES